MVKQIDADKGYAIMDGLFAEIQRNGYKATQEMLDAAHRKWCELPGKETTAESLTETGIGRDELMSELSEIFQGDATNDRFNYVLELADSYAEHEARQEILKDPTVESHPETEVVKGCIALMQSLMGDFEEYLEFMGIYPETEEERFSVTYNYGKIIQRLLLWTTHHSGGASTAQKCRELGFDYGDSITFSDDRQTEGADLEDADLEAGEEHKEEAK